MTEKSVARARPVAKKTGAKKTALRVVPGHARIFVGTSGWAYPTWKPGFYPADVTAKKFLSFYASRLNGVEVNYTFSKLPGAAVVAEWMELAALRPGFRFSFKAPQRITHFARLRECEAHVGGLLTALEPVRKAGALGAVLFQLPPNFKADMARLADFLAVPCLRAAEAPKIAFEFRHESWFAAGMRERLGELLAENEAALCIAETDTLVSPEMHTAPGHTYFRLRRAGGYKARELQAMAARFVELAERREVYVALRHEDEPTGALNAVSLLRAAVKAAGEAAQ